MAIANDPDVLIADEPTTALDVTIQAQVLDVPGADPGAHRVAHPAHHPRPGRGGRTGRRVLVTYAGEQVEMGPVDDIFYESRYPYTWACSPPFPG